MTYLAYVSLVPCYWLALMAVVAVVAAVVTLVTPKQKRNQLPLRIVGAGVATTLLAWIVLAVGTNVERTLTAPARWEIRDDANVTLIDSPPTGGGGWTVHSPQLVSHLREKKPDRVTVTFPGWYDFGRLRSTGFPTSVDEIPVHEPPRAARP